MGFLNKLIKLFVPEKKERKKIEQLPTVDISSTIEIKADVLKQEVNETPKQHLDEANQRKWRLTYYYVSEQNLWKGAATVPVYDKNKKLLASVEPGFFAQMSLEGTGKCRDGRLLNVADVNVPVNSDDYAPVWEYHKKFLTNRPPGYSGLVVKNDIVVAAAAYFVIQQSALGKGYGILRGIPMDPFRTIAADIGVHGKHDSRFKGKGGLVPLTSKVYIREFVGVKCPDGQGGNFIHDGWFVVNDTGGGIYGAHFDIFVGTKSLVSNVKIPAIAHVWFDGIDTKVNPEYTFGLDD